MYKQNERKDRELFTYVKLGVEIAFTRTEPILPSLLQSGRFQLGAHAHACSVHSSTFAICTLIILRGCSQLPRGLTVGCAGFKLLVPEIASAPFEGTLIEF